MRHLNLGKKNFGKRPTNTPKPSFPGKKLNFSSSSFLKKTQQLKSSPLFKKGNSYSPNKAFSTNSASFPAYRSLGRSGLKVSELSFGSWITFGDRAYEDTKQLVKHSYENGVNFFDTAEVYDQGKAETLLGRCVKDLGIKRSQMVISTKLYWGGPTVNEKGLSRKHLMEGTDDALKRLQLDNVDLLFCHRPDPETPMEEIVRTMNTLIQQGKIFYWGTSEWNSTQLMEAYMTAEKLGLEGPTMEQPEYNLFTRDKMEYQYPPLFQKYGLGTTIWSPLKFGILTGKYNSSNWDKSWRSHHNERLAKTLASETGKEYLKKVDGLMKLGERVGESVANLSLAWCLMNPNVSTVILGASNIDQLKKNLSCIETYQKLQENPEIMKEIELIVDNKPKQDINFRGR